MVPAPPTLTSELPSALPPAPPARFPAPPPQDDTAPIWLQRLSLAVLVVFCLLLGGVLACLPWSPRLWDQNGWILSHPPVAAVLHQGWVRGLVSGLGLIDIWIGISELLHYRDYRR